MKGKRERTQGGDSATRLTHRSALRVTVQPLCLLRGVLEKHQGPARSKSRGVRQGPFPCAQLVGRRGPQMSYLGQELLVGGSQFEHAAPVPPGSQPRRHAGSHGLRRGLGSLAQQLLGVAGEGLEQQQQPVPTGTKRSLDRRSQGMGPRRSTAPGASPPAGSPPGDERSCDPPGPRPPRSCVWGDASY